ncbi:uncharacterized protein CDAR_8041 [Caerostris darwini]|uniref:Uncharacterized protein n=1 Tax=Caerostris darwini TaxID=1538125 RepID=A0AAV4RT34_9ARAC|nr:uncharacterized protein CDAR_8041 [Caerostris darwini]
MNNRKDPKREGGDSPECNEVTRDSWVNTRSPGSNERSAGVKPWKPSPGTGASTDTCGQLGPLMGKDDTDSLAQSCKEEKKKKSTAKQRAVKKKRKGKKRGELCCANPGFFPFFLLLL